MSVLIYPIHTQRSRTNLILRRPCLCMYVISIPLKKTISAVSISKPTNQRTNPSIHQLFTPSTESPLPLPPADLIHSLTRSCEARQSINAPSHVTEDRLTNSGLPETSLSRRLIEIESCNNDITSRVIFQIRMLHGFFFRKITCCCCCSCWMLEFVRYNIYVCMYITER